ncbi:MAG: DUF1015 domain-containing protein [Alphaproteobacteria bacterium]|nr:DUF1015 domain-containing protein [Alphaproteobacteria bacterium]
MSLFRPFKAVRPIPDTASQVVAPPYDVLNTTEARQKASKKPFSFLHISKAEIDLPDGTDPYDASVYEKAKENYRELLDKGILIQEDKPCYYIYRAEMAGHVQTGFAVQASVDAYNSGRIRRHELTRVDKEDDRVRQIQALDAQTGPALLAFEYIPVVDEIIKKTVETQYLYSVLGDNDVRHTIWKIDNDKDIETLTKAFDQLKIVYIADGHHRSAAASRLQKIKQQSNANHTGEENYNYFLAVAFPINEMKIYDYNRVVTDLNGLTTDEFLEKLSQHFDIKETAQFAPDQKSTFSMYLDHRWFRLVLKTKLTTTDPIKTLDVSVLSDLVLTPILNIGDPRTDKRIDFVGGVRGLGELRKRVDSGEMAVAFALYPTQMSELTAVADHHQIMPPKSTWFEPKLADGLVSNSTKD